MHAAGLRLLLACLGQGGAPLLLGCPYSPVGSSVWGRSAGGRADTKRHEAPPAGLTQGRDAGGAAAALSIGRLERGREKRGGPFQGGLPRDVGQTSEHGRWGGIAWALPLTRQVLTLCRLHSPHLQNGASALTRAAGLLAELPEQLPGPRKHFGPVTTANSAAAQPGCPRGADLWIKLGLGPARSNSYMWLHVRL